MMYSFLCTVLGIFKETFLARNAHTYQCPIYHVEQSMYMFVQGWNSSLHSGGITPILELGGRQSYMEFAHTHTHTHNISTFYLPISMSFRSRPKFSISLFYQNFLFHFPRSLNFFSWLINIYFLNAVSTIRCTFVL